MGTAKALYLSLEACKSLCLIPDDFSHHPRAAATVGGLHVTKDPSTLGDNLSLQPSEVPLSPLEENLARLEKWLLRHFSSTAFNTNRGLHYQSLKPGAVPYTCHTPASVPKHWEAEMKSQLWEDIRRGVIELVPVGEATVVHKNGGSG